MLSNCTIVLYSILFYSNRSQLNSTQLILVSCVVCSEWWWGMMSLTQIRIQSVHGVSHWMIVGVQCWLCYSFFLCFCIARLPSIGCCITVRVEIAWFWFLQLGYCRSQCICECSSVTLNTVIFASTNVVKHPFLHMISMIVVLPGHSPLLVRGDVSN